MTAINLYLGSSGIADYVVIRSADHLQAWNPNTNAWVSLNTIAAAVWKTTFGITLTERLSSDSVGTGNYYLTWPTGIVAPAAYPVEIKLTVDGSLTNDKSYGMHVVNFNGTRELIESDDAKKGDKMDLADSLNQTGITDLKAKLGTISASGDWNTITPPTVQAVSTQVWIDKPTIGTSTLTTTDIDNRLAAYPVQKANTAVTLPIDQNADVATYPVTDALGSVKDLAIYQSKEIWITTLGATSNIIRIPLYDLSQQTIYNTVDEQFITLSGSNTLGRIIPVGTKWWIAEKSTSGAPVIHVLSASNPLSSPQTITITGADGYYPYDMAFDGTSVWATMTKDGTTTSYVAKFTASTRAQVGMYPVTCLPARALSLDIAGSFLWFITDDNSKIGHSQLVRFNLSDQTYSLAYSPNANFTRFNSVINDADGVWVGVEGRNFGMVATNFNLVKFDKVNPATVSTVYLTKMGGNCWIINNGTYFIDAIVTDIYSTLFARFLKANPLDAEITPLPVIDMSAGDQSHFGLVTDGITDYAGIYGSTPYLMRIRQSSFVGTIASKSNNLDIAVSTRHPSGAAVAKSPATLDWTGDVSNRPTIPAAITDYQQRSVAVTLPTAPEGYGGGSVQLTNQNILTLAGAILETPENKLKTNTAGYVTAAREDGTAIYYTISIDALCSRADVEDLYGTDNVIKYADLNENGDETEIAARIARAITVATCDFYDHIRNGRYVVPLKFLDGVSAATVVNKIASFTGVLLYEASGVQDFNPETGKPQHRLHFQRQQYERFCDELMAGKIKLNAERTGYGTNAPTVIK